MSRKSEERKISFYLIYRFIAIPAEAQNDFLSNLKSCFYKVYMEEK